ncbi:MAG: hypothetical protein ACK4UJ_04325 [Leptonema sp. (in: bacteria)]
MKVFKLFIGIGIIFFTLFLGFLIPIFYIYQSGKTFIEEIQTQTKNRAIEIAFALDTMSGESIYHDNMISLSNVMLRILENNNNRNDPYKIKEIFLLNDKNQLLAHSDFTKLARDFQPYYDPLKYKLGTLLFSGSPVQLEIIGTTKIEYPEIIKKLNSITKVFFNIEDAIQKGIEKSIPDLLANEFHLYTSVYPPDEIIPKGSLHLLIENLGIGPLVSYWIQEMFYVFSLSLIAFLLLFFGFSFILFLLFFKKREPDFETYKSTIPKEDLALGLQEVDKDIWEDKVLEEEKSDKVIPIEDLKKSKDLKVSKQDKESKTSSVSKDVEFKEKKIVNQYESILDAQPLE